MKKNSSQELKALGTAFWETMLRHKPAFATFLGDHRYNDRLDCLDDSGRQAWLSDLKRLKTQAKSIDPSALSESEKVTWDVLRLRTDQEIETLGHHFHQWAVDQLEGPQAQLADLMEVTPLETEKDAKDLIKRFEAFPQHFNDHVENLKRGLKEGRIASRPACDRVLLQLENLISQGPQECPWGKKAASMPKSLAKTYRAKAMAAVEQSVLPTLKEFHSFLKIEYLPRARKERVGLGAIPEGAAAYRERVRYHTTTDKTPQELHDLGLSELRKIQEEMTVIARQSGHKGNLVSFLQSVRKNPKNHFKTRQEILKSAQKELALAYKKLPKYFGKLPKNICVVRPMEAHHEKTAPIAFYYQPDVKLTRNGVYFINASEPQAKNKHEMTGLAVHEAVPGHHLQIALALENKNLPDFRRNIHFTAFTEGWGLYTERLAVEMDLYRDSLSRLGMLSYQALRACRLVVDTGLHAFDWSRQKAIDFMLQNTPVSKEEVVLEVDRYIVLPGQALSYMVGMKEIQALRSYAQNQLKSRFNLRDFHDLILSNGSIPLSTLKQVVQRWVN